jgi:hypothetical protein
MTGLAPYIAAGFAAALAVTSLEFSLAGTSSGTGALGSQEAFSSVNSLHAPATVSRKGDLLKSRSATEQTETVSTIELVGLRDATIVLVRDAGGQVLYRSDPMNGVTVVSKGVVLPQVTIRETDQASPRNEPAEAVRPPVALPEGCDPAVSSITAVSASKFGVRCLTAREQDVKVAGLFD